MLWRVLLALWLGVVGTWAVPPPPVPLEREAPWRIVNLAADAGLERRMVFDVAFTTNHLAWFATSDGLYRYDGYHWQRFGAGDGLPSNFIRTVTVTRGGRLWVGTDRGAGVFDGERFDREGSEGKLAGSNVRRVVETRDGALWFCCDRWPDSTVPGGLTRWGPEGWRTYTSADGLPADHLLGLFEQSNGRIIALTSGGPAWKRGESWIPLEDAGYPPRDHTWAMAETPDGVVFAQAFPRTFRLGERGWEACSGLRGATGAPFCVAADGALVTVAMVAPDTMTFQRWDGQSFRTVSGPVTLPGADELVARAAPDGAVWVVGRGTVIRWEYVPGTWEWWPELPPPRLEDRTGQVWCASGTNAALWVQGVEGGAVFAD